MKAIMASTAKVKSSMQSLKGLLPTDYPSLLAPWLMGGVARQALNVFRESGMASRLPMAANLAMVIGSAFLQAQALLVSPAPVLVRTTPAARKTAKTQSGSASSVKTRKIAVKKATHAVNLEKPPSVKNAKRTDTGSGEIPAKPSNAPSHGKPVVQTASTKRPPQKAGSGQSRTARRST